MKRDRHEFSIVCKWFFIYQALVKFSVTLRWTHFLVNRWPTHSKSIILNLKTINRWKKPSIANTSKCPALMVVNKIADEIRTKSDVIVIEAARFEQSELWNLTERHNVWWTVQYNGYYLLKLCLRERTGTAAFNWFYCVWPVAFDRSIFRLDDLLYNFQWGDLFRFKVSIQLKLRRVKWHTRTRDESRSFRPFLELRFCLCFFFRIFGLILVYLKIVPHLQPTIIRYIDFFQKFV